MLLKEVTMANQRNRTYSNHKAQLDIDLEEERQALLEDQKIFRQRAQKLSVETNRRRKALEERRREEEQKEQRFREDVLQQRKLKLQEATEKFQRAHLPPSQRRRAVYTNYKRPTPKLDDAIEQIQGSSFYYLPNHRSPTNTRTTDTPSGFSASGTWPRSQQASAKLSFEKIFQEKFDSNHLYFHHRLEEAQRLLEEQHLSTVQNFHHEVEQLANSESLSSLDSLEENVTTPKDDIINAVQESSNNTLHKALTDINTWNGGNHYSNEKNSGPISQYKPPETPPSIPGKMIIERHIRDNETLLRNGTQNAMTDKITQNGASHPGNMFISSPSFQDLNSFSQVPLAGNKPGYSDMSYREGTARNAVVRPSRAWGTPDPAPTEVVQVPQDNKDTVQLSVLPMKPAMTQLLATPVVVPFSESSASNWQHSVITESKPSNHSLTSVTGPEDMANTYNSQFYTMRTEKGKSPETIHRETPLHENQSLPSNISKAEPGVTQGPKDDPNRPNPSQDDPDIALSAMYRKSKYQSTAKEGSKLLKGILKKGSKYESGYAKALGIGKMFQLGEKSSVGIRDSVELTKEKGHKQKNNKKLRWLDEIDKIMDTYKDAIGGITNTRVTQKPQAEADSTITYKEQALSLSGSSPDQTSTPNPVISTGYHFMKQAWMTSKGEEVNPGPAGHLHNVRSPPKAKTRVVRRPKSAKTPSATMHQNRKGIIIRPQSATEASRITKSQGKVLAPHPPPKPSSDSNNNNRETTAEARSHTANPNSNTAALSSHFLNRDTMPSQTLSRSVGNLMAAQSFSPPDPENATKSILTLNSERVFALQESLSAPAKRHHVFGDNGLRLDHTPTDEEIALLWHGVRSALSHKNNAGDFRPGDLPSNLQPARHNLSSVVIDGAALNNWKTLSRTNGFFSPINNGYVTLAKRKQILDCTENNRRALLEQRRGRPVSATLRAPLIQNLHTMKLSPFPSAHEPGQAHSASAEVSESQAQFLLAEKLVETSATDGEILATMQAKHKGSGHSALSIEEQRLLQSLDRLNHRLQNVQENTTKSPAATNGFPLTPPLHIYQLASQAADTPTHSQRYRSLSADPRTRMQRR